MSFIADVMSPGGGILLLPFIRIVVGVLLLTTSCIFIAGVARIHMAILSFLCGGLLVSLSMFETAYNNAKQQAAQNNGGDNKTSTTTAAAAANNNKTD